MSTACGHPQGEGGAHVDVCGQGEGDKNRIFVWTSYMDGPLASWHP